MKEAFLDVCDVSKRYGRTVALDGVENGALEPEAVRGGGPIALVVADEQFAEQFPRPGDRGHRGLAVRWRFAPLAPIMLRSPR